MPSLPLSQSRAVVLVSPRHHGSRSFRVSVLRQCGPWPTAALALNRYSGIAMIRLPAPAAARRDRRVPL